MRPASSLAVSLAVWSFVGSHSPAAEPSQPPADSATPGAASPAVPEAKHAAPTEQQTKALVACLGCHDISAERKVLVGPPLYGIWGARPVTVGIPFSSWDRSALDRWLKDPAKVVPQTRMTYKVANSKKRQEVINALESLR